MATLDRGIQPPSSTQITLNNRLFESDKGSLLATFWPDSPAASLHGTDKLLFGGTGGYLDVFIAHNADGSGYKIKIVTNGTVPVTKQVPESGSFDYKNEITLGVVYDTTLGSLKAAASLDPDQNPVVSNIPDATLGIVFDGATIGVVTATDARESIGLDDYSGFISKVFTYSTTMDDDSLLGFLESPATWPEPDRVHTLDLTNLTSISRIDATQPSTQTLVFSGAPNTGVITIDGVEVDVTANTSAANVAKAVAATLSSSPVFATQVEKQTITFEVNGVGASTLTLGGVSGITGATALLLAADAKDKLEEEGSAFMVAHPGSRIVNNGDGSITITYSSTDGPSSNGNPSPLSIIATGDYAASVKTTQLFQAIGTGRKVVYDEVAAPNAVSITFNSADGVTPLMSSSAAAEGFKFSPGSTGVSISVSETTAAIPSIFQFDKTPVTAIQRITVTSEADTSTNATITVEGSTLTAALSSADTISGLVDDLVAASANLTGNILISDFIDDGDSVLINFASSAGQTLAVFDGSAAGTNAFVIFDQEYAENTRGESQTLVFGGSGSGSLLVDGITATITNATSGVDVAREVEKALEKSSNYATPEIQTIVIRKGPDSNGGDFALAGRNYSVSSADTTSSIAELIANDFMTSAQPTNITNVEAEGSAIHFTFTTASADVSLLTGFSDAAGASASGVLATEMRTTQSYNPDGVRKTTVQGDSLTIVFPSQDDDAGTIQVNNASASTITASVLHDSDHHTVSLNSSDYSGSGLQVEVLQGDNVKISNVLYTELVSLNSAQMTLNVFIDPAYKDVLTDGEGNVAFESLDFTMTYNALSIFGNTNEPRPDVVPGSSSVKYTVNGQQGVLQASWLNVDGIEDFSQPVASFTFDRTSTTASTASFSFTNVNIDGKEFTSGLTHDETDDPTATYSSAFSDQVQLVRTDVTSTLVSGLDGTTGIGGQMVVYHANPTTNAPQVRLQFNELYDPQQAEPTLELTPKTLAFDVVAATQNITTSTFVIELPSNAVLASFIAEDGVTASGAQDGRSLIITHTAGIVPIGGTLGTVEVTLDEAQDKTHEFTFTTAASIVNGNSLNTAQGLYFGYTMTDTALETKGEWVAKDIPTGIFNRYVIGTAETQSSTVIKAPDALSILKLATGSNLPWQDQVTPASAAFVAADLDGSGRVNAADALIALKYNVNNYNPENANPDPVTWMFLDGNTTGLTTRSASPSALKTDIAINADGTYDSSDVQVQAVLVGNLTNPTLDPF